MSILYNSTQITVRFRNMVVKGKVPWGEFQDIKMPQIRVIYRNPLLLQGPQEYCRGRRCCACLRSHTCRRHYTCCRGHRGRRCCRDHRSLRHLQHMVHSCPPPPAKEDSWICMQDPSKSYCNLTAKSELVG